MLDRHEVAVRARDPGELLPDDVLRIVDQLLHPLTSHRAVDHARLTVKSHFAA